MTHLKYCVALATLLSMPLYAQDADESGADDAAEVEPTPQAQGAESSASPDQPRAMSGMSIDREVFLRELRFHDIRQGGE